MTSQKIRVLLVDDHIVARKGIRLMLGMDDGIDVAGEAETAHAALDLLQSQPFDVAIIDIGLSDQNGLQLLKRLRREWPRLAVLMLSMYAETVYAVRALQYGAAGYLTKNSSAAVLVGAVYKAAAGGKYITPAVTEKIANIIGGSALSCYEKLSDRELEVLRLLAAGEDLGSIAQMLHLSPNTIATYRTRLLEKTGAKNNVQLTRFAIENGIGPSILGDS
ncbi:DNA-binding response regulator [Janthinobacterium sp. BJB1]|nr:DNA-binding response regulator [Janthinobacterium sp. BJB303]PJC98229.1 DNA-binding response regulator [Janthinobacterium sp. BJB1]